MTPRLLPALLAALLWAPASASLPEIPPSQAPAPVTSPQPSSTPPLRVQAPVLTVPAGYLEGVTASLRAVPAGAGTLGLSLTLQSSRAVPTGLTLARQSAQNCAYAPLVRVIRVGTREVVYPAGGKSICTQEVLSREIAPRGRLTLTRELKLPPGEYMLEGWLTALNGPRPVRVSAAPVRVSVK